MVYKDNSNLPLEDMLTITFIVKTKMIMEYVNVQSVETKIGKLLYLFRGLLINGAFYTFGL